MVCIFNQLTMYITLVIGSYICVGGSKKAVIVCIYPVHV